MVISIASLFPQLYRAFLKTSLIARAQEKKIIEVNLKNLFSYASASNRVDSPSFGHGAGMLIKPNIVESAIEDIEKQHGKAYKVFFSPHGTKLDQRLLKFFAQRITSYQHVLLLPARYEGMDARVEEYYADITVSLGDMVLMGGDLPAMVLMEGLMRLLPEVVGRHESVEHDSFMGPFVDYPEFTKPVIWHNMSVPDIVRSGNHQALAAWRNEIAACRTVFSHFDWLRSHIVRQEDKKRALKFMPNHYVVLMHTDVLLEAGKIGTSSVTSIDIHDIARSASTFGLKKFYIVTPLKDQQKIVNTLLDFWRSDKGIAYNSNRKKALDRVRLVSSLEEVRQDIWQETDNQPLLIATAAQKKWSIKNITYKDQKLVWRYRRPVLFILGTARGLSEHIIQSCDYVINPIEGFSDFNHLSVRSAAAIIFDRWLGIQLASSDMTTASDMSKKL